MFIPLGEAEKSFEKPMSIAIEEIPKMCYRKLLLTRSS